MSTDALFRIKPTMPFRSSDGAMGTVFVDLDRDAEVLPGFRSALALNGDQVAARQCPETGLAELALGGEQPLRLLVTTASAVALGGRMQHASARGWRGSVQLILHFDRLGFRRYQVMLTRQAATQRLRTNLLVAAQAAAAEGLG